MHLRVVKVDLIGCISLALGPGKNVLEFAVSSGTLPKGRKAKGWLVYEVPTSGRCVLSYGANSFISQGAVFEVLLRSK